MPNLFNFGMPLQEGNTMTTFGLIPPTSSTKGDIGEHYLIPNITFHNLLYNQIWNGDNYYTKISTTENDYEIQLTKSDNWKTKMGQQLLVAEYSANILQPGHTYFIMADIRTEVNDTDWKNDTYDTYIEYNNEKIVKLENVLSNNENSLRLQAFIIMPNIEEEEEVITNKTSLKIVVDCNQNSTKNATTAYISNITCLDFTKDIPLILQQNNAMFSEQEWYNFMNKYSKTFNNESNIYQYSNHCYICNGINDNRYEWYLTDNAHGINSLIRGIPTNPPTHGIKDIYNWEFLDGNTEIPLTNIDANSILWQTATGQYTANISTDLDINMNNLTYLSCVVDKNKNIFNFFKEGNNFHIYYTDAKGENTKLFLKNVYTTTDIYYYRIQESKDYLYVYIDNKIIEIPTNNYEDYKIYTLSVSTNQQPNGEIYTSTPNFFNNNHWEKREILFYNNFIFIYIHQPAPSGGKKDTDYLYMGSIDKNKQTIELQQIDTNIFRLCYIQTPQGLYPYWLRYESTFGHAGSYTEQQISTISLVSFKDDLFEITDNNTHFIVSTVFNDTCYYTSGSRRNFRSPRTDYLTINDKPIYSVFSLNAYHSRSDVMSSYPWANGYGFYHIIFIPDLHQVIHVNSKTLADDIKDEKDYYMIRINRSNTSLQIGIQLRKNNYYKYDFTLMSIINDSLRYNSLLSNVDEMFVSGISSTSLIPAGNRFSPFENQTFVQTHWIFSNGYYIANTNYLTNLPSPNFHSYFGEPEKYLYINYFLTDYDNLDLKIDTSNNTISSSQNVNISKVILTLDGDQLFDIPDNQYWLKVRDE